jgi:AraC-like DNA-binding protein
MRPQLIQVSTGPAHSFNIRRDVTPHIKNRLHYHPEIELILIVNGSGTQYVGDNTRSFHSGDLILVGSNLPHFWEYNKKYFNNKSEAPEAIVIHFREDFWGEEFLKLPENEKLLQVLNKAKRGLLITGNTRTEVTEMASNLLVTEGPDRIILLMEMLSAIAESSHTSILSSKNFKYDYQHYENDRMAAIHEYTLANFKRKIQLDEIAKIAGISPHSFCRYFKLRARKTYFEFLIEIKVGYACQLLTENKLNIKQICFESGFNNFASFHKYFKMRTGKSPLTYQKEFKQASMLS